MVKGKNSILTTSFKDWVLFLIYNLSLEFYNFTIIILLLYYHFMSGYLETKFSGKIKINSRYYDSFRILISRLSEDKSFRMVNDELHQKPHSPYLYNGYKSLLEPEYIAPLIIKSINDYLDENLFNSDERELLLEELQPYIHCYGKSTIDSLKSKISGAQGLEQYKDSIKEYEKTITALLQIRQLLILGIKETSGALQSSAPIVFVSYSHDNEEHKAWVLDLCTRLRSNGVNILLDRWNLKLGSNIASFMEHGLSQSNRIICVCSDNYIRKANEGLGGAGYEKQIITAELMINQNTEWVIPLVFNNKGKNKTPYFLSGRMYISFDGPQTNEEQYEVLLRDLLNEPVLPIPPLGKNPFKES